MPLDTVSDMVRVWEFKLAIEILCDNLVEVLAEPSVRLIVARPSVLAAVAIPSSRIQIRPW